MTAKVVVAMKPRARANENTAVKPFRSIVTSRSAVIRCNVVIPIRTVGRNADIDAYLSVSRRTNRA